MKLRKILSLALAAALTCGALYGCAPDSGDNTTAATKDATEATTSQTNPTDRSYPADNGAFCTL